MTPTINVMIEGENFIKLVENLEYYMGLEALPLCEKYVDPIDSTITYPKIRIGDIEVNCFHDKTCAEAVDNWERRRKRINYNNVFVVGNSWNMKNDKKAITRLLANSPYKTIVFSTKEGYCEGTILLSDKIWHLDKRGIAKPNITNYVPNGYKRYYETIFDYVSWLNE